MSKQHDYQVGGTHYIAMAVQPWDVIDQWEHDQRVGFYRGNVIKYTMRAGEKDDAMQDLKKALHYLQKLISVLEEARG